MPAIRRRIQCRASHAEMPTQRLNPTDSRNTNVMACPRRLASGGRQTPLVRVTCAPFVPGPRPPDGARAPSFARSRPRDHRPSQLAARRGDDAGRPAGGPVRAGVGEQARYSIRHMYGVNNTSDIYVDASPTWTEPALTIFASKTRSFPAQQLTRSGRSRSCSSALRERVRSFGGASVHHTEDSVITKRGFRVDSHWVARPWRAWRS